MHTVAVGVAQSLAREHHCLTIFNTAPFFPWQPAVDHDYSKVMQQRSHAGSCYPSDEEGDTDGTDSCCSSMDESDANENKIQTCSICLEAFHVGERVSWSSTNLCDHGFHPFCIQEWLIRHEDCPMCRQRFMLCDFSGKRVPTTMLRVLRKEYKKRKEETCFSIHDGLMNLKGAGEKCNDDNGTCLCERFSGDSEEMKEDDAVRAEKGCSKALNTTMPLESDEEDENGPCV